MRLDRKILLVSIAALTLLGITVLPGLAAPEKQFTIAAPLSVSPGASTLNVVVRNTTPNGNSNISSVILYADGPDGFSIDGPNPVSPGAGVVSDGGSTVSINGFSPIKPNRGTTFTLKVTIPDLGCAGGSIQWRAEAFTGNSFGGDAFSFKDNIAASGALPATNTVTTIQSGCSTITVTKYEDADVDGVGEAGEVAGGWQFQLKDGEGTPIGTTATTNANGQIVYTVPAGDYIVCETDPRADPTSPDYADWVNTVPGGNRCTDVLTLASGGSESVEFLNSLGTLGCDADNNTDTVTSPDEGSTVTLVRLPNPGDPPAPCILVPYTLEIEDNGDVTFIKDLSIQPDARFVLTQTIVRDTVFDTSPALYVLTPNTINGYSTSIQYDVNAAPSTAVDVLPCSAVTRDGIGNVTGATPPATQAYCVAEQSAFHGSPGAGFVTIVNVYYGEGDPVLRSRPST